MCTSGGRQCKTVTVLIRGLRLFVNPNQTWSRFRNNIASEGKITILGRNQKSEEIIQVYLIFYAFGDIICDIIGGNVHVCLGG